MAKKSALPPLCAKTSLAAAQPFSHAASTVYNDGGTNYPNVYIVLGKRIIDLSGMSSEEQIYSLANVELNGYDAKTPVIVAATLRIDS